MVAEGDDHLLKDGDVVELFPESKEIMLQKAKQNIALASTEKMEGRIGRDIFLAGLLHIAEEGRIGQEVSF